MSYFAMFSCLPILSFMALLSVGNGAFDYYALVIQWPATYCRNGPTSKCTLPVPNKFTVHGLWPSNYTKPDPRSCSSVSLPPLSTIQTWSCAADLDLYWPNLSGPNVTFWSHEWSAHGTCSNLSPFDYFSLTMRLYQKLKVFDLLQNLKQNFGVVPLPDPQGYSIAKLQAALKATLGSGNHNVYIDCINLYGVTFLKEVRIFINPKSLDVFSSPTVSSGTCGKGPISFPPV